MIIKKLLTTAALSCSISLAMEPDVEMTVFKEHKTKPVYYQPKENEHMAFLPTVILPTVIMAEGLSYALFNKNRNFEHAVQDFQALSQVNRHFYENRSFMKLPNQELAQQFDLNPKIVKAFLQTNSEWLNTKDKDLKYTSISLYTGILAHHDKNGTKLAKLISRCFLIKQANRLVMISKSAKAKAIVNHFLKKYNFVAFQSYKRNLDLFEGDFLEIDETLHDPLEIGFNNRAKEYVNFLETSYPRTKILLFKRTDYVLRLDAKDVLVTPNQRIFILGMGWYPLQKVAQGFLQSDSVCLAELPSLNKLKKTFYTDDKVELPIKYHPLIKLSEEYFNNDEENLNSFDRSDKYRWQHLAFDKEKQEIIIGNNAGQQLRFPLRSLTK